MAKVTVIGRRRLEKLAESYGVDVDAEEQQGRLVQHVEGKISGSSSACMKVRKYRIHATVSAGC